MSRRACHSNTRLRSTSVDNNFITDIFRWLPDSYSFIYINCQPSQIHSAIFLEYRVSISKNFRYGELHFKISPGNPVAFRHKFNLISTCSIHHCVKIDVGKENRICRIRLTRNSVIVSLLIKNTLSDF